MSKRPVTVDSESSERNAGSKMESLLKRIERNRREHDRLIALILCLSLIVSMGTFAVFHKTAVAKTYTRQVLDCPLAAEGAGLVVHTHNDDCYDENHNLVCTLPELEAHTHSDACYTEVPVQVCGLAESVGHVHGSDCRTLMLTCEEEEREATFDEEGNMADPGHIHTPDCYSEVLSCGMEEGDWAHTHTDACYETEYLLTCDKPEILPHVHTDDCYQKNEDGSIYVDENGYSWLICGLPEVVQHVHGPECFTVYELDDGEPEEADEIVAADEIAAEPAEDTDTAESIDEEKTDAEESGDKENTVLTEAQETKETTDTEDIPMPAVLMPAQSWERTAGGIKVSVEAPEGAFPENTRIAVTPVNGNSLVDTVSDAVNGEVLEVQAVDITFFDADGHEIEPAIPIRVVMTPVTTQHAEEKTSVVHIDLAQQTAKLIEQAEGTETDNTEVVFDAEAFTIYAIVYTYHVDFEYEVDGKVYSSSMPGAKDMPLDEIVKGLSIVEEAELETFLSKIASVTSTNEEVAVVTEDRSVRVLKDGDAQIVITMQDGAKFELDVKAEGETSVETENVAISTVNDLFLPTDAVAKAEVVADDAAVEAVKAETGDIESGVKTAYQVFDISLENVEADNYEGFRVDLKLPESVDNKNLHLYHVHDGMVEELELDQAEAGEEAELVETVSFVTPSFSYFVLTYTVDFSFEVDGRIFDFSLPGGGFIAFSDLVRALGIAADDPETEDYEVQLFVENVETLTFSEPTLLWTGKVEYDTSVGTLKGENGLNCEYSAELTDEKIAAINAAEVKAIDWALISLKPFTSEETLTVTMKNGEVFTIQVTDAQVIPDAEKDTIDVNKSYLICYEVDGVYYLLKNDGSVENAYHPNFEGDTDAEHDFEHLNSTYAWSFHHIFKEQDVEHHLDKNYYLIRPIDDKSKTLTLNNAGEILVQSSNNNVAVIQTEDGFILEGYHNLGTEEEPRYIHLGFDGSNFVGVDGDGVTVHVYVMDSLPTYDYTVRSADEIRGTVTVSDGTQQNVIDAGEVVAHYYDATSTADKKNGGTITAVPVRHMNQGQNKWLFDHWELNGLPLDRAQYGETILAETLPIPHNGSNLVAYFRQNPAYVVPPNEKEPSSIEDMSGWLEELQNRNIPLDRTATKKTAEVYDYQNRIYRVDFSSKANFETFAGNLDMAFCLDVSNSMYFPSALVETTSANHVNPMPIYQINNNGWYWNNQGWLDTSRNWNNPYYLIADASGTATVFRIYYQNGSWKAQDASRTEESDKSFIIGQRFETNWCKGCDDWSNNNPKGTLHPFGYYDNNDTYYVIYDAGDYGNNRFVYLNQSLSGGSTDLNTISGLLAVAGDASPGVRIAYNTFNKDLGNQRMDFQPASSGLTVNLNYAAGGGTRPDQAFNDAQNFNWTAEYTVDGGGNLLTTDRYVVLVTDGAPQGYNTKRGETDQTDVIGLARSAATNLKNNAHVKLITVGLSMDDVTSGKQLLYDLADFDNKGNKMFYLAESGSDLHNIFRQITKVLMEDAVVLGNVTDTVGEAFYLVDKATGLPLKAGDTIDIEGNLTTDINKVAGVVQNDGKTVVWTDQPIDSVAGWHGTVYVKAQEELLGGNGMNTNDGEATIVATKYHVGGNDIPFVTTPVHNTLNLTAELPSPKVNVNELTFFNNETEWTVYLGTEVDPKQQLKAIYDSLVVEEVVNDDGSLHYTISPNSIEERWNAAAGTAATFSLPGLIERLIRKDSSLEMRYFSGSELNWDVFLEDIMSTETDEGKTVVKGITLPYHEYGLTDGSNIKITLEKTITEGEEADLINHSPHVTTVAGDEVEKYVLRIAYNPDYSVTPVGQGGQSNVDFHTGTFGTMYQGHATGREASTNEHKINVYAKSIEVVKLRSAAEPAELADPTEPAGPAEPADPTEPVEPAEPAALTEVLTDKSATFSLYRKWKSTDGEDKKVSLKGYTVDGTELDDPGSDEDYFFLVESQMTDNGVAKFTTGLIPADNPYYVVETQAPQGYQQNKVIQTVTITPGPNTTTTITTPPVTTMTEEDVTTDMPYNWTQGVRFYFNDSETPAVYVDGSGNQIVPITGDGARTYALPTDAEGWFETSVLNTPLGYLQVRKIVTYNNDTPTSEELVSLAGTYSFGVYVDQGCEHPYEVDGTQVTLDVTISGNAEASSSVISLPVGTYWIKEMSEPGSGILPNDNPLEITITAEKIADDPAIVTFTNNKNVDDDKDKLAIELEKQFTGLLDKSHIPESFKVVLSYKVGTSDRSIDLTNADHGNVGVDQVNIDWSESADGFTWHWKITNLPYEASDFKVKEDKYDKATGYEWIGTTLNGENVSDPSQESSQTVLKPTIAFQSVGENEINPDNDKTFLFNEDMIWLLRSTSHEGVVVISVHTLSYSTRLAVEDYIHTHAFPQAQWGNLAVSYYSEEAHPDGFSVHGNKLKLEPLNPPSGNYNYQLTVGKNQSNHNYFYELIYDQHSDANSFKYVNDYQEYPITIDVVKVAKNTGEKLSGAVFTLRQIKDAEPGNGGTYATEDGTTSQDSAPTVETTGLTSFGGLAHGYYELSEKIAPAGYVLTGETVTYFKIERGVVTWLVKGEGKPSTWAAKTSKDAGELVDFEAAVAADTEHNIAAQNATFTVENTPGTALPMTGGPGTTLFTALGGLLTATAGAILTLASFRRRRETVS